MKFNSLIQELSVTDIDVSIKFYKTIGFNILYERKEDKFYFLEYEDKEFLIQDPDGYLLRFNN